MTRKIIQNSTSIGIKDENGIYSIVKPNPIVIDTSISIVESNLSIDNLLRDGLLAISRAMKFLTSSITSGNFDEDTITMLKNCMAMLHELKKKEAELLEDMSDEDLAKLAEKK